MSDFALTTFFVVPSGTLASTGSTQDLTPNQLGIFGPDYAVLTAGTIAAAKYFTIVQGRGLGAFPELGSKGSDKIHSSKVIDWYKTVGDLDVAGEVFTISGFNFKCDQSINVTIRAFSNYIDIFAYNGFTRTVSAQTPCCDCGEAPCETVDAAGTQAVVDQLVAKINAPATSPDGSSQMILSNYFIASRTGTGLSSALVIRAKPLPVYSNPWDPYAYLPEYDRLTFRAFAYAGPALTNEYVTDDICEAVAGVGTVTQRATYPKGTSAEVSLLEKKYYSYQTSRFKHLHKDFGFNPGYETAVTPGIAYDLYYLTFQDYNQGGYAWTPKLHENSGVILAFPSGQGAAFETVLTAALGAPVNKSGVDITTTTSTSTSSTTTTSTTVLIP